MALIDRNTIKNWFRRGLKPLESQFAAWIDSYWHKNDTIPIESIDNLQQILSDKADQEAVDNAIINALQNVTVQDASLNNKGIVQLTNEYGHSDNLAATQSLVQHLKDDVTDNYFTKTQTQDLITQQITGLTWKDWVEEVDDLPLAYPEPEVGWLVPVKSISKIYKWNGNAWVDSGLGTLPAGLLRFDTDQNNNPTHNGFELATKEYVDEHIPSIPDATTQQKGLVMLTDVVEDDSTKAVTGKAVHDALRDVNLVGEPGPQGPAGPQGLSAFEVWLQQPGNENKTVAEFFNSLRGERGYDGQPGPAGEDGISAYEQWRQLPGNASKTFDDFLDYLSKRQGFDFNMLFYNTTESAISFTAPVIITYTAKDTNINNVQYSFDGIVFNDLPTGNVSISIGANQTVYFRIVFSGSALAGNVTLKGNYI